MARSVEKPSHQVLEAVAPTEERLAGFGWRRLQGSAAAMMLAAFAVLIALEGFDPFFLILTVPVAIGLALLRMRNRIGVIWLGVVSLALLLMNMPFLPTALANPASVQDFIVVSIFVLATLIMVIGTIPAFRQGRGVDRKSSRASVVGLVAAVLGVAAIATGVVAGATFENAPAQAGDIRVTTGDFEFSPASVSGDASTISVHVTNQDSTLHTFTIDELGVDVPVPGGKEVRVTFEAAAGTYTFYCKPHSPDMKGTITVT